MNTSPLPLRPLHGATATAIAFTLALLACAAPTLAAETANTAVDIELRLTNDLRNRGVSDSLNRPAAKLSVQAAHASGVVGVLELATVSKKQFLDGSGVGVTAGVGYRFGDPDAWHFGVGAAGEWFPGARFVAPQAIDAETFTPLALRSTRYDSQFLVLEAGHGALEARALWVASTTYRGANTGGVCGQMLQVSADPTAGLACYARGEAGTRGSLLLDANYRVELDPRTALTLHAGLQRLKHFKEADLDDIGLGITHQRWGFAFTAEILATHARVRALYLVPDGDRLRATDDSTLVLSVARKF